VHLVAMSLGKRKIVLYLGEISAYRKELIPDRYINKSLFESNVS
jgi:hypothetical protein